MKILAFGDAHIQRINEYSKMEDDGFTSLLHECRESLQFIADHIEEAQGEYDMVVNLGDLFDDKRVVDGLSVAIGWKYMKGLYDVCASYNIPIVSLVGNHEWIREGSISTVPFLEAFGQLVTSPIKIEGALFVPYVKNAAEAMEYINDYVDTQTQEGKPPIIFSHLDVVGGWWYGRQSDRGIEVNSIGRSVIFNGHYHTPQVLENEDGGVIVNVGALMYKNFKDQFNPAGEQRGFITIDWNGDDVEWDRVINPKTSLFYTLNPEGEDQFYDKLFEVMPNDKMNLRVIPTGFSLPENVIPDNNFRNVKILPGPSKAVERHAFRSDANPHSIWKCFLESEGIEEEIESGVAACKELGDSLLDKSIAMTPDVSYEDITITEWGGENFLSINKVTMVIPTETKVVMVVGENNDSIAMDSNGAGKSALLEILSFGIWGRLIRKYATIDEAISTNNPKAGCYTYVNLTKGNKSYKIERARKWGGSKGTFVNLYVDGELVENTTQKDVDELIKLTHQEFKHLVYLGGTEHFTGINDDTKRKSIIESIIGTTLYSTAENLSAEEHSNRESVVSGILNREAETDTIVATLEVEIDELKYVIEETEKQSKEKIVLWKGKIVQEENEVEKLKEKVVNKQEEAKNKNSTLESWKTKRTNLKEKRTFEQQASDIQVDIASLISRRRDKMDLLKQGICDKCGTRITLKKTQDEVLVMDASIDTAKVNLKALEEKISDLKQKNRTMEKNVDTLRTKIMVIDGHASGFEGDIRRCRRSIEDYRKEILKIQEETNLLTPRLKDKENSLLASRDRLDLIRKNLEEARTEMHIALDVKKMFHATKLRSFVLDFALQQGNDFIKSIANTLSGGDVEVGFSPTRSVNKNKKTLSKIDFNTNTHAPSFGMCSSGERDRMDLMLQLALSELSRTYRNLFNILIIDEEGAGVDEIGMDNLLKVLYNLDRVVFIVSHQPRLKNAVTSRILAKKENHYTNYQFENVV